LKLINCLLANPSRKTAKTAARKAAPLLALLAIAGIAACAAPAPTAPKRAPEVRAEFMRAHPCPANGRTSGACPGFQVDHILAICAGGADSAANMQWLAVDLHKIKTRSDAAACRRKTVPALYD
jgi:hypothetical protein